MYLDSTLRVSAAPRLYPPPSPLHSPPRGHKPRFKYLLLCMDKVDCSSAGLLFIFGPCCDVFITGRQVHGSSQAAWTWWCHVLTRSSSTDSCCNSRQRFVLEPTGTYMGCYGACTTRWWSGSRFAVNMKLSFLPRSENSALIDIVDYLNQVIWVKYLGSLIIDLSVFSTSSSSRS